VLQSLCPKKLSAALRPRGTSPAEADAGAATAGIAPHIAVRSPPQVRAGYRHRHAHRDRRTRRQCARRHLPRSISLPSVATLTRSFASHAIIRVKSLSTAVCSFRPVIPEIDIWRAATLMLKRYGDKALEQSDRRVDDLTAAGDHDGADTWRRITAAVEQLANTTPPGPLH